MQTMQRITWSGQKSTLAEMEKDIETLKTEMKSLKENDAFDTKILNKIYKVGYICFSVLCAVLIFYIVVFK